MRQAAEKIVRVIDGLNRIMGQVAGWMVLALVLITVYDVVMRYVFRAGSVGIQEAEWHLYSANFLLAAGWTLLNRGHVRVDMLYQRFKLKTKAWVDVVGSVLFCIPYCLLILWAAWPFVLDSWVLNEGSPDPGGLPARYVLKTIILVSFVLLGFQAISETIKNVLVLKGHREQP
ncbi:MAG: TRAP transporter small permease subunit [Deltaproteobacteria bacterium]|nr:TRAP transporter small permease subunit [Deltaproteobacteria bacterium]